MLIDKENRVVKIIALRDNLTLDQAVEVVQECAEEIEYYLERHDDPSLEWVGEIIADMLGLEPDYIQDLICY